MIQSSSLLFGVCPGPTLEDAQKQLNDCALYGDGVELRIDLFSSWDILSLQALLRSFPGKVLLTYRSKENEDMLLQKWKDLAILKPDYIDLCVDTPAKVFDWIRTMLPSTKMIASYHGDMSLESLQTAWSRLETIKADIFKIAMIVYSTTDALKMLAFTQDKVKKGMKMIAQGIGDCGVLTRILSPVFGSAISYASAAGATTARGQLDLKLMRSYYAKLSSETRLYAVIGDPIDHSLSPALHNALFERYGHNAHYLALRIKKAELSSFFMVLRDLPHFHGISITMPHKEECLRYMDRLCIHSRRIKAVNTCVKKEGRLLGYNTDFLGFSRAVLERHIVKGKSWCVIGSGGAARACIYALHRLGAFISVKTRTVNGHDRLQKDLLCGLLPSKNVYDYTLAAIPDNALESYQDAIDISYRSERKQSLGRPFFIYQALAQQRLWAMLQRQQCDSEYSQLSSMLFSTADLS